MAFIPDDAKWYLAELVEEIQIEDELQNIIHINLTLVRADSPEEAYEKAKELGGGKVKLVTKTQKGNWSR